MRIVHSILLLIMLLFVAVQLNDPDGALWGMIYMTPVVLLLVAVVRPLLFASVPGKLLRWCIVVCLGVAMLYFWPKTPGFWRQDVWWETETAREGMGMMIAFLVAASTFLTRSSPDHSKK